LIIDTPGPYRLCEDITFDPNAPTGGQSPAEAFDPDFGVYSENTYGLGYFAAIVIAADGVDLYLDGHTLEQSAGHALMQRFFANIELSSSPFLPSVGPAQFVGDDDTFVAATNVRILGPGVIGRSAHHGKSPSSMESNDATCQNNTPLSGTLSAPPGIHGNNNANIEIRDVTFRDFEVAAVSLNNVDNLEIRDNTMRGNRKDVPVTGMFSAARFIR
jgi:hypothetical protein